MSVGKNLLNKEVNNCIAVIGDGAITGGMAYEAMNNAGEPSLHRNRPTPTPTPSFFQHPSPLTPLPPPPTSLY